MSLSRIVNGDSLRRTASSPQIPNVDDFRASRSSPARCGSDPPHPVTLPPASTGHSIIDDREPTEAGLPRHISLQSRVSNDFGPAYDYLGKVKQLADGIKPGLYHDLFGKHCLADVKIGARGVVVSEEHTKPLELEYLRLGVQSASNEYPCLLIAEGLSASMIQMLGQALNVDPGFFARHLEQLDPARESLSDINQLQDQYRAFIDAQCNRTQSSATIDPAATDAARTLYMEGGAYDNEFGKDIEYLQSIWPQPGTARINSNRTALYAMQPRISYALVAKHSWLILVDQPVPILEKTSGPFHVLSMLNIKGQLLPIELQSRQYYGSQISLMDHLSAALSDTAVRKLLFGHGEVRLATVEALLPPIVVIKIWHRNVEYMEKQLAVHRHKAIASPSMATFVPLTVMRRNIADLQDAIVNARKSVGQGLNFDRNKFGTEADEFTSQYDMLLQRVKDMSTLLNNEIQLVIGSVAVQDSAIMKKQARRATLLTILAVIYLPLTLVTGIFGMNIKEINGGAPLFWSCISALVVIAALTAAGYFGYKFWQTSHDAREVEEREQENKIYKVA